jgi:predicted metalloprotease with PDZ domain
MDVEVSVEDLSTHELGIRIFLSDIGPGPLRVRGIPTYVDNPLAEAVGEVVTSLRFSTEVGELEAVRGTGTRGETVWTLHAGQSPVMIEYVLQPDFVAGAIVEKYGILVPFLDEKRAWLTGNHVFLSPEFGEDRMRDLREPVDIRLRFELPESIALIGPPPDVEMQNLHELLSLQFGLGDFEVLPVHGSGWKGEVILMNGPAISSDERKRLVTAMEAMTERTGRLFGGVPFDSVGLLAFHAEGFGGLEGSWACQAYFPPDVDLADDRDSRVSIFFRVAFHELVHTWLPIGIFPLEDPWVKEGVTSYYGNVLAAREGFIGPADVDRLFARYEDDVFGEVDLESVSLSDPRLWHEEYSGESWRRVSYERGHAVTLLLDVHLRTESDNRRSLDHVMRLLFERHRGQGFGRGDLLAAVRDETGVEVADFFSTWVDGVDAPPSAAVDRALREAVRFGVYDAD